MGLIEYPKEVGENLRFRGEILKASEDEKVRAAVVEVARRDILFFFNVFLWTFDPRMDGMKEIPFVTWGYQDEFILGLSGDLDRGENVFIDKSRDMGATWCILGVFLWRWLGRFEYSF
jgi:hypothetical protein